jgi:hypothetical protein
MLSLNNWYILLRCFNRRKYICYLELVAFVITSCLQVVITPLSFASPTEFVPTHLACNVIAPLVLLYWLFTVRTLLCVLNDPSYVLTFCGVLWIPEFNDGAISWSVSLQTTFKTEIVTTMTLYVVVNAIKRFYTVCTTRRWTPTNIAIIVCVGLTWILLV